MKQSDIVCVCSVFRVSHHQSGRNPEPEQPEDGRPEARITAGGDPDRLSLDIRVPVPVARLVRVQHVLLRAQHRCVLAEQRAAAARPQSATHPAAGERAEQQQQLIAHRHSPQFQQLLVSYQKVRDVDPNALTFCAIN